MTRSASRLMVAGLEKIPRTKAYLIRLSDGSRVKALGDDVARLGICEGTEVEQHVLKEASEGYEAAKARAMAMRLLRTRPRTEYELRRSLREKGVAARTLDMLIADLKAGGHVDDRLFAKLWIKEKIAGGNSGRVRIARDLATKGIARETAEEELARDYDRRAELEIAKRLALRRLSRLTSLGVETRRRRVYNLLVRRGFGYETASAALRWALDASGGDSIE